METSEIVAIAMVIDHWSFLVSKNKVIQLRLECHLFKHMLHIHTEF